MSILEKIKSELKKAMKSKDKNSLLIYRGILAATHNKEIELKKERLTDDEVAAVLESQAKQRRDSIIEFQKGGRADLVKKEKDELEKISKYLPSKMPDNEVEKIVKEAISKTGAKKIQDRGKVMAEVMKNKGQIDGATASRIVSQKLNK